MTNEAHALQSNFHQKLGIPTERILIHPDNIADPVSKATARVTYGDVILGIPASPFPEFIAAFVQGERSREDCSRMALGLHSTEG